MSKATLITFQFTVKANNSTKPVSVTHILKITDPIRELAYPFTGMILQKGTMAMPNTPTFKGSSPAFSFDASTPPPSGLEIDPSTGVIHGMPTEASGKQNYIINASNEYNTPGAAAKATVSIVVVNTLHIPDSVEDRLRRKHHSATLLRDGQVMIAGGTDCDGAPLNTIEIYDPATGKFQLFGRPLTTARSHHTSSLMADGRVLIAGGEKSQNNPLASLEAINAVTSDVASLGNLGTPRISPVAISLSDGRVVFGGGTSASKIDEFDTLGLKIATRTLVPNINLGYAKGTLLANGKILFAGLFSTGTELVYDPTNRSSVPVVAPSTPTKFNSVTGLFDGTALLAGGSLADETVRGVSFLFSPSNNSFTPGPNLQTPRAQHTANLMLDGSVMIIGGVD